MVTTAITTTSADFVTLVLAGDLTDTSGIDAAIAEVAATIVGRRAAVVVDICGVTVLGIGGFRAVANLNNAVPAFGAGLSFRATRGPVGNILNLLRGARDVAFV